MNRFLGSFFGLIVFIGFSQEQTNNTFVDVNYFKGNIALHNKSVLHLIQGHPEGVIIGWNRETDGSKLWEQRFNYPDYGFSLSYHDLKSDILGKTYGLYAHYNFYFLKRHLMFRVAQGLNFATNPYDKFSNPKNNAFGSRVLSGTYLMLNYKSPKLMGPIGLQAGFTFTHASNGSSKSPNTSINTMALNIGIHYDLEATDIDYKHVEDESQFSRALQYNFIVRFGVNQSNIVGSPQYPFYTFSAYVNKQITIKSALSLGVDAFFSKSLKAYIRYQSIAYPGPENDPNLDHKRVGVFAGYELIINKLSVISQLGYYVYYPYKFEGQVYNRIGMKYKLNKKWFTAITLKSHIAKAETLAIGIGIQL